VKAWPASLFGRNLLLFIALILLGQVVNAVLYREWVLKPRLQVSASAVALDLQALEASNLIRECLFEGNDAHWLRGRRKGGVPLSAVVEDATRRWMD